MAADKKTVPRVGIHYIGHIVSGFPLGVRSDNSVIEFKVEKISPSGDYIKIEHELGKTEWRPTREVVFLEELPVTQRRKPNARKSGQD